MDKEGLVHPIVVDTNGVLIAGLRRFMAAKKLGWKTIPCTTIEVAKSDIYRLAMIENLQRLEFSKAQRAKCYLRLMKKYPNKYPNQKSLSKSLGISEAKISQDLASIGKQKKYSKVAMSTLPKELTFSIEDKKLVVHVALDIPKDRKLLNVKKLLRNIISKTNSSKLNKVLKPNLKGLRMKNE